MSAAQLQLIPTVNANELHFVYLGAGYDQANLLRRSLMTEVPCYAIHNVTFFTKSGYVACASSTPETISQRLGQLPLIQSDLPASPEDAIYFIDVASDQGIYPVTSRDIKHRETGEPLPVAGEFELARLKVGEHLNCDIRLKSGTGRDHMKYMSVSAVGIPRTHHPLGTLMTCELTGQYDAQTILELGLAGLANTLTFPAENIFYQLAPDAMGGQ